MATKNEKRAKIRKIGKKNLASSSRFCIVVCIRSTVRKAARLAVKVASINTWLRNMMMLEITIMARMMMKRVKRTMLVTRSDHKEPISGDKDPRRESLGSFTSTLGSGILIY